ncbi:MAG TPA: hypothetical protein VK737_03850 [Opitutales bacterium]|jgi:hypothetical protein|nr:hypothetical protein [Opitutales bacterium]
MPSSLTDEQKAKITQWVADGASLAEVQKRLAAEFSVSLTYMDTRFLLDDLNLTVKEKPKPSPAAELSNAAAAPTDAPSVSPLGGPEAPAGPGGKVKVWVDKIVRPGAALSGGVTFSDGQSAEWYMDQTGRLGLIPKTKGYQPKQTDVQDFQIALQEEMTRMGY